MSQQIQTTGQDQGQNQSQFQGMTLTEIGRFSEDILETESPLGQAGPCRSSTFHDDRGDDLNTYEEEGEEEEVIDTNEEEAEKTQARCSLRDLIGCRIPRVLIRLVSENNGQLKAALTIPVTEDIAPALAELQALVEKCFSIRSREEKKGTGQPNRPAPGHDFSEEDWAYLLGTRPAKPFQRLCLLARLALSGTNKLENRTGNNLMHKRFAAKFAALPDGMPFSLRWLLRDKRGERKNGKKRVHPFDQLPRPIKEIALHEAVARGQETGKMGYNDLRFILRDVLHEWKLDTGLPTYKHVKNLKEGWKRKEKRKSKPRKPARSVKR